MTRIEAIRTLNKSFTAPIVKSQKTAGWTYVVCPASAAFFGTRGLVKVRAEIDGYPFRSAFMPLGDGNHKLPVKAEILRAIGKKAGRTGESHALGASRATAKKSASN